MPYSSWKRVSRLTLHLARESAVFKSYVRLRATLQFLNTVLFWRGMLRDDDIPSHYISQKRMALFECFLNSKKNQVKLFSTSSLIINELYNAFGLAQKLITKKLSFFCEKAWSFQIIVISLHSQNGNVYVDVPWCNGSTRVFGSLSPRSNRSGTTSPSLEPCGSIPIFTQGSFLQLCLYDTAFLFYTDDISVVLTKKQELAFITITYST